LKVGLLFQTINYKYLPARGGHFRLGRFIVGHKYLIFWTNTLSKFEQQICHSIEFRLRSPPLSAKHLLLLFSIYLNICYCCLAIIIIIITSPEITNHMKDHSWKKKKSYPRVRNESSKTITPWLRLQCISKCLIICVLVVWYI